MLKITPQLVQNLIKEQFPQYAHEPLIKVEPGGWDNRTFRLGNDRLVRLPSGESYALQVEKEQKWLPFLSSSLSIPIPKPYHVGKATASFPYPWSIYSWIDGISVDQATLSEEDLGQLANDLAEFLRELHTIPIVQAPLPGLHNYWRGDHIRVYDRQAREQILELSRYIPVATALNIWECALQTQWQEFPVWVHGDFAAGNILMKEGKLCAVIDFGCMGVGDPACDLVIAWTLFRGRSRDIFREKVGLDDQTWCRAKAWCLWKATYELCQMDIRDTEKEKRQKSIVGDLLSEGMII